MTNNQNPAMTFAYNVEQSNGKFVASLLGMPKLQSVGDTAQQAINGLRAEIHAAVTRGDIGSLNIDSGGLSDLAGAFADDPELRDICEEAYRLRDAELAALDE